MIRVLLITTLILSACSFKEPGIKDTGIKIPAAWNQAKKQKDFDENAWWSEFKSTELSNLIDDVIKNNFDIKQAALRVKQAKESYDVKIYDQIPNVNLGLDASRSQRKFVGFPIPGSEEQVLSSTSNSFGLSLDISWEIDFWGRVNASSKAGKYRYLAENEVYNAALDSLVAQTVKQYVSFINLKETCSLDRQVVKIEEHSLAATESQYLLGLLDYQALLNAKQNRERAVIAANQCKENLADLRRQIEILAGRYPSGKLNFKTNWPKISKKIPAGIPSEIINRRPDLKAAELKLYAENAEVAASKRDLLPKLVLTASGGTLSNEFRDIIDDNFSVWGLAGSLVQPIINSQRNLSKVEIAKANREIALHEYAKTVQNAFYEVESSLNSDKLLYKREKAAQAYFNQAKKLAKINKERYQQGIVPYLTWLSQEKQFKQVKKEYLNSRLERVSNRVNLYLALGGDFFIEETA